MDYTPSLRKSKQLDEKMGTNRSPSRSAKHQLLWLSDHRWNGVLSWLGATKDWSRKNVIVLSNGQDRAITAQFDHVCDHRMKVHVRDGFLSRLLEKFEFLSKIFNQTLSVMSILSPFDYMIYFIDRVFYEWYFLRVLNLICAGANGLSFVFSSPNGL